MTKIFFRKIIKNFQSFENFEFKFFENLKTKFRFLFKIMPRIICKNYSS